MKLPLTVGAVVALAAYTATVPASNLLITYVGPVPIGFGLIAPAGVFVAGLSLALRDAVHETAGVWWAVAALVAGAALSWLIANPQVAVASAVAFAVSEAADLAIYQPLRRRGRALAVAASGAVGLVVDSWLFLQIAFGSHEFLPGQILAKVYMTVLAVTFFWAASKRRPARAEAAA